MYPFIHSLIIAFQVRILPLPPSTSIYNKARATVAPPTSTTQAAAPNEAYSTGLNTPAALFPLAEGELVEVGVVEAGREESFASEV